MAALIETDNVLIIEPLVDEGGPLTIYCSNCGGTAKDIDLYVPTIEIDRWSFSHYEGDTNMAVFYYSKGVYAEASDDPTTAECSTCGHVWTVDYDTHDFDFG